MQFAIVSGIVTEEAPVSYWPFSSSQKSLRRLTRPSFLFFTVANTLPLLWVR